MDEREILKALEAIGIPRFKYYPQVGSTNDLAIEWAKAGSPEFSLVIANSQIAGRGRLNRNWVTNEGEGLAFSIVLRPKPDERISLFSALGGIAVCDTFIQNLLLPATIKWPNSRGSPLGWIP